MSHRPIKAKQVNRMVRALRKGRLPASINLVDWLRVRGYADTAGQAQDILTRGLVSAGSHPLGKRTVKTGEDTHKEVFDPFVPAAIREDIVCLAPKRKAWL